MKTEIWGYETTPFALSARPGGYVVEQVWWGKDMTDVIADVNEARRQLEIIAKAHDCWKPMRRKVQP